MTGIFKRLSKITAVLCLIALTVTLFPVGCFEASADETQPVKVEKTQAAYFAADEYGWPTEFVNKKKTIKFDSGKVMLTTSYPKFMGIEAEDGNVALMKKLNKALYKDFYTSLLEAAQALYLEAGHEKGDNAVLHVDAQLAEITRLGNIISITEEVSRYYDGGAYPSTYFLTRNFNLSTGKSIANLSKIFNKTSALKKDIIKAVKAQVKEMKASPMFGDAFYEDIDWSLVKQSIDIRLMSFNYAGVEISIPEGLLGPHALGTQTFKLGKDLLYKYIKKDQLINPLSSGVFELPENPSTGYHWNIDFYSGDHYLEPVGTYYESSNNDPMIVGAGGTRYFHFRALNPGQSTINFVLYSPSGEEADKMDVNVNITDDLFFFEVNSEGYLPSLDAKVGVVKTEFVRVDCEDGLVTKKKTVKYDSGEILLTSHYPTVSSMDKDSSSIASVKNLNKALKKAFYTEVLNDAKKLYEGNGHKKGDNAVLNVEVEYNRPNKVGNLLSLTETVTTYYDGGSYPTFSTKTLNFNLHTGKRITSLGTIFNSTSYLKKDIVAQIKSTVKKLRKENEDYLFYDKIDWTEVKKAITVDNISFSPFGMTVTIPEGILGPHALGYMEFLISNDTLFMYCKDSQSQLLAPLSSVSYFMDCNPSTGYLWEYIPANDEECVEMMGNYYCPNDLYSFEVGGSGQQCITFRAVKPGDTTIKLAKFSPAGEEVESQIINVSIGEDLFFFETNG